MILLTTLSAISFGTGDARAGSVMAIMVALSVGLRFWQEARADAAAEKLKAMIHVTATAIRDGVGRRCRSGDLVPGDIILWRLPGLGRFAGVVRVLLPMADFRQVLAVFVDILLVLDQLAIELLL